MLLNQSKFLSSVSLKRPVDFIITLVPFFFLIRAVLIFFLYSYLSMVTDDQMVVSIGSKEKTYDLIKIKSLVSFFG